MRLRLRNHDDRICGHGVEFTCAVEIWIDLGRRLVGRRGRVGGGEVENGSLYLNDSWGVVRVRGDTRLGTPTNHQLSVRRWPAELM